MPVLARLLERHPGLKIDARLSDMYSDVIREGLDAVVRIGPLADSRLVSKLVGHQHLIVTASPAYLARHGTPRNPYELERHQCVLFRVPTTGRDRPWQFRVEGVNVEIQPEARLRLGDGEALIEAAAAGLGLVQTPDYMAADALAAGRVHRSARRLPRAAAADKRGLSNHAHAAAARARVHRRAERTRRRETAHSAILRASRRGPACVRIVWLPSAAEYSSLLMIVWAGAALAAEQPPTLTIGSPLPAFSLPGIDGKTYTDQSFKDAKILVLVFTCPHCPTAQAYQERIKRLVNEYSPKGVTLVAINPNHADAVRLDEMAYTDVGDSFAEMKERARDQKFNYLWLDDGPKQELSHKMGPVATPHVFIFDKARKLRFEGRIDDSERESLGHQARHAQRVGRAHRRQGAAGHHHAGVRLLGEVGGQGGRIRQVQGALGQGAGDARKGRRRSHQGHSRKQGHRQAAHDQCVGDLVRAVYHRVRRAGRASPALPHPRLRDGDHRRRISRTWKAR